MNVLQFLLQSISAPFDAGSKVELKFASPADDCELYLRVKPAEAATWQVGDTYVARLVRLP